MDDKEYLDWFNKGYALSVHRPELAEKISNALSKHSDGRASGFKDGHRQYSLEKEHTKEPDYLRTQNYVPKSSPHHDTTTKKDIDIDKA